MSIVLQSLLLVMLLGGVARAEEPGCVPSRYQPNKCDVPAPALGAGLLGVIATAGVIYLIHRRRRRPS